MFLLFGIIHDKSMVIEYPAMKSEALVPLPHVICRLTAPYVGLGTVLVMVADATNHEVSPGSFCNVAFHESETVRFVLPVSQ